MRRPDWMVLDPLAGALLAGPDEGGPTLEPGDPRVAENVARTIATLPWDERRGCRVLFLALPFLPLLLGPRRGLFHRLSRDERRAFLEGLRLSRWRFLRYLFFCLKSIVAMAYYARPETWPAIGYDGPYLGRVEVTVLDPPPLAAGPLPPAPPRPVIQGGRGA